MRILHMKLKHPVPDNLLVKVGDIVVSFAILESCVQGLLFVLLGEDQRIGKIMAAQLSFRRLRDSVKSLYAERFDSTHDLKHLEELLKEVDSIEQERDKIMHSDWAAGDATNTVTRIKITARHSCPN